MLLIGIEKSQLNIENHLIKLMIIGLIFIFSTCAVYAVEVSIPEITAEANEIIEIPIKVGEIKGLFSIQLTVEYDAEIIIIGPVKNTPLTKNFLKATNVVSPGKLLISLASARTTNGQGAMVIILAKVKAKTPSGEVSPLNITTARLNEGAIGVTVTNGQLIVGAGVAVKEQQRRCASWGKIKMGF
jgi:hypothetical protein